MVEREVVFKGDKTLGVCASFLQQVSYVIQSVT